jgi:predicted dehydrogenase
MTRRTRVAIVGCGAMVEKVHLPQLAIRDDCEVVALVDRAVPRVSALAGRFGIGRVLTSHRDLLGSDVDAVLVAAPNHLHAPISIELLEAGLHVLVEKPMALTVADCDAMLETARRSGAVLAVGLMRRFAHAGLFAKWAIQAGLLGTIQTFTIRDGFVYAWPVTSDAFLRRATAGGGVLMDLGTHAVDQMLWWLGEVDSFEYYDDSYGGVEADCELHVSLKCGGRGTIECSRTRDLGQTAMIRGDRAELEVSLVGNPVTLRFTSGGQALAGQALGGAAWTGQRQRIPDLIAAEHTDFLDAIRFGGCPAVPGEEGRRSLALIERCYRSRRALRLPWVEPETATTPERTAEHAV